MARSGGGEAVANPALDVEHGVVVRTFAAHVTVDRRFESLPLEQFLEIRLRILGAHRFGSLDLDPWLDHAAGGLEAAVDEYGPDNGFQGVGQDRLFFSAARLLLAVAQVERRAKIQFPCAPGQRFGTHDMGPGPRQDAFRGRRMRLVEPGRHNHPEHRIAQKLQSFVVPVQAPFVREGAVSQGLFQQRAVLEPVVEPPFEVLDRVVQG